MENQPMWISFNNYYALRIGCETHCQFMQKPSHRFMSFSRALIKSGTTKTHSKQADALGTKTKCILDILSSIFQENRTFGLTFSHDGLPSTSVDDNWPTMKDIKTSQSRSSKSYPKDYTSTEDIVKDGNGTIWIPSSDEELKLRIMIAGHSGLG
eukprot:IDg5106t1